MKIRTVCTLAVLFMSVSLFSQKVKLKNMQDSVSYAIGVSMYNGSKQFKTALDYELVSAGILSANENKALMEVQEANDYIGKIAQQIHEASVKEAAAAGENFMKENMKEEGVRTSESGLQYKVIKQGSGPKPTINDRVKVHYTGYLLDGTKFDSSIDRGEPAVFGLNQVIAGWTEALQLMSAGSEYVIYCPPHLAYGDRQMGELIKPGSTLMFEIQFLEIVKE